MYWKQYVLHITRAASTKCTYVCIANANFVALVKHTTGKLFGWKTLELSLCNDNNLYFLNILAVLDILIKCTDL